MKRGGLGIVLAAVLLLGAGACRKAERLLLLDVRASGGLPSTVSALHFSAMDWPARSVAGALGPAGLLFGYYGPSGSGPVTVTVEAVDASNCVLGSGTATVLDTSSGQATPKAVVYVYPLSDTTCVLPDAGADAADADASDAEAGADADGASTDSSDAEGGTEAGADARADGGADAAVDRAGDGTSSTDAGVDTVSGGDAAAANDGAADAADATPG